MSGLYKQSGQRDDRPKAKWYNWVGDPYWDDYCLFMGIFVFIPGFVYIGFCIGAIISGGVS